MREVILAYAQYRAAVLIMAEIIMGYGGLAFYLFAVLDERLQCKKWAGFLLLAGLPSGIFAVLANWLIDQALPAYILVSAGVFVFGTWGIRVLWKHRRLQAFCEICLSAILQVSTSSMVSSICQKIVWEKTQSLELFLLAVGAVFLPLSFLISSLMRNMHFGSMMQFLLNDEQHIRWTAACMLFLELIIEVFFINREVLRRQPLIIYNATVVILTILLVGILLYLSYLWESTRKIQMQESLILQQQMYVEHLEEIQREMRIFRHDYKNMLSSMYLYAKEGEAEKIQESLEKLEIDFDHKIGEKIHMASQLGNIRLPEVKSLVMSKMTKMHKCGIECRLEVLYPLERIGMDIWDFNRCLGILLDNAIEAAEALAECGTVKGAGAGDKPYVELLLMKQGRFLTVHVANSSKQEADLARIWEEGYSTKGENRGLGLSNYRKILEKYPDALPVTSWENDLFVQEFTISCISPQSKAVIGLTK